MEELTRKQGRHKCCVQALLRVGCCGHPGKQNQVAKNLLPKSIGIAGLPQSGKNIWKMNFFPGQGKSGDFVDGQGNLERIWKVREKSGNLKINGYGRHRKFIYSVQEGKGLHSYKIV